jgi:WD40 repeat protein
MAFPHPTEYHEAIQNPRHCFRDPDLRHGQPVLDPLGLPRVCSGNFADVYHIQGASGHGWAVKCFTRERPGLGQRYQAISDHLRRHPLPFMVRFLYLEDGIRVGGRWYPVLKMRWVEGLTLNAFLRDHLDHVPLLQRLADLWVKVAEQLRTAQVAHGDLQHSNVLLVACDRVGKLTLKLIDYDGMFVPDLAEQAPGEVGHPNYQHPTRLREGTYNAEVDRFPHLLIYTALRVLAVGGRPLWERYDNGENLLFREQDFQMPGESALLRELGELPDPSVRVLVRSVLLARQQPLERVPLLRELLADKQLASEAPNGRARVDHARQHRKPAPCKACGRPRAWTALTCPACGDTNWRALVSGVTLALLCFVSALLAGVAMSHTPTPASLGDSAAAPAAPPAAAPDRTPAVAQKEAGASSDKSGLKNQQSAPVARTSREPSPPLPASARTEPAEVPVLSSGEVRQFTGHTRSVTAVAFAPDGRRCVSASWDGTVRVWDTETGTLLQSYRGDPTPRSVAFSPDGRGLLLSGVRNGVWLWDLTQDRERWRLDRRTAGYDARVAFASGGRDLVSGASNGAVCRWDAATGKELQRFASYPRGTRVTDVAFAADGNRFVTATSQGVLHLWDVEASQVVQSFAGHPAEVTAVAFAPDGRHLVSASEDRALRLWDVKTGKEIRRFTGYVGVITSVAFAPDSRHFVTGGSDSAVRLWHIEQRDGSKLFSGHYDTVNCVAVSPDGKYALSGSADTTVRLWRLPVLRVAAAAPLAPAPPPAVLPLEGTSWRMLESEDWTCRFEEGGVLSYSSRGQDFRNGTWKQKEAAVYFELNRRYAEYRGTLNGDRIEGTATNVKGQRWAWSLKKQ